MAAPSHLIAKRYDSNGLGGIDGSELRDAGARATRHIVLALDTTEAAEKLLQWAIVNLHRKGDVFHVVHVAKILAPHEDIQHQVPGTSLSFHDRSIGQAKVDAERAKVFVRERFVAPLQAAHIQYQPHLFVEGENAPPESIAEAVDGVAKEVNGTMIVVARSNKTTFQKLVLGSVAAKLSALPWPVVMVPFDTQAHGGSDVSVNS